MRYSVPQIQYQTKIGGLSMKQIAFLGIGIGISFVILFSFPEQTVYLAPPILFIAIAFSFGRVGGVPLPTFLQNYITHLFFPRIYKWHKKTMIPKKIEKIETNIIKPQSEKTFQTRQKGLIRRLSDKQI